MKHLLIILLCVASIASLAQAEQGAKANDIEIRIGDKKYKGGLSSRAVWVRNQFDSLAVVINNQGELITALKERQTETQQKSDVCYALLQRAWALLSQADQHNLYSQYKDEFDQYTLLKPKE